MNRNAFRYFMSVFESGSIREAVASLGVAQSSVSRQIIHLEEELDVRLLDRLPHGVALTQAGEVLVRHAREATARLERLQSEIGSLQGLRRGVVRIAIVDSFTDQVVPSCLEAFRARHPDISFEVLVGTTSRILKLVRERRAEFGIGYNLPPESDIRIDVSLPERIVALMRPDHRLAGREQLTTTDLADVKLSLPRPGSGNRLLIDAAAKYRGVVLKPAVESDSVPLRVSLAASSDIVALLAEIAAVRALASGALIAVPLRDRRLNDGRIELFSMTGRPLTVAAEAFSHLIQRRLQDISLRGLGRQPVTEASRSRG